MSTAAATTKAGYYLSKNQTQKNVEIDSTSLASNVDTGRLRSAMTGFSIQKSSRVKPGSAATTEGRLGRHRVSNSMYMRSYKTDAAPRAEEDTPALSSPMN